MKKRIISLCMAVVLLFAMLPHITLSVDAAEVVASGTCGDNLIWTLDDEGTLAITGHGSMDNYVFNGSPWCEFCANIESVTMQSGITNIGNYAFSGCFSLVNISIPNTVLEIGENAFRGCTNLSSICIPESVSTIGEWAFYLCSRLSTVSISEGVMIIDDCAFHDCKALTEIVIPNSITRIGDEAFAGCSSLAGIRVDEKNQDYTSDSYGVLFSKDKSVLLQAPQTIQGDYSIPEEVKSIYDSAFFECKNLAKIILPDGVKRIGDMAFSFCENLSDVVIPESVESIGKWAFAWCANLSDVWYTESQTHWRSINIKSENDDLLDANIHFNYTMPNYNGFWLNKDGWTFANASQSFAEEPASHANDYFIPRERYDVLFGSSYVDAHDDLFTTNWGGNCAGMSATAILFFLDSLDWESIDAEYSEDFSNPNDFYRTVNLHNQSQSYYPAIGNNTEVTRLIEAYQLYINAIDKSRLVENLDNTYFEADVTEKNTLFGSEYIVNHVAGGSYIATMLAEFQEAYDENNPLLIVLQAEGFGHGIVSRTDLKPEDMGDGWWRVYVYDPNKPYFNESVSSVVSGVEAEPKYTFGCNTLVDNGGDIYLELNPSLNQWRYCTSVNSNSADSYIGSSPSGELLWKTYYHDATPENENDDEGKKNNAKIPDYFYTIDLTDLSMEDFANPHFDSTSAWIPENDLAVAVNGSTNCSIYASTGELVAIVEDGDAFVLSDAGSYDAYIGQPEDGGSLGGKIYLPDDVYTMYCTSGAVQFLGSDNALSFSCEGAVELTVDIALNSLQILAQKDGIVAVKCANVTSTDECSYVDTEGALAVGETLTIAYSDENKVEASTDSKDGEFQLYQKDANQEEAVATKVVKSSSLWWLWIVGGVAVAGVVLFILLKKKKPNA